MSLLEEFKNLKSEAELDPARKREIRERLIHYMDVVEPRPLHSAVVDAPKVSWWAGVLRPVPILAALSGVILLGGGVSLAAEGALPGDLLYPVKVSLNENMLGSLAFSPEAEAEWEIRRAERRLEESAQLVVKGASDEEVRRHLEARFEAHADKAEARILAIEAQGRVGAAADLATKFETSLRVHDALLGKFAMNSARSEDNRTMGAKLVPEDKDSRPEKENNREEIAMAATPPVAASFEKSVNAKLKEVSKLRMKLEARIESSVDQGTDIRPAAEGKIKAALNVVAANRSYIEKMDGRLRSSAGMSLGVNVTGTLRATSTSPTAQAELKLQEADRLIAQAKMKLEGGFFGEAFSLANTALRTAQEAKLNLEFGPGRDDDGDKDDDEAESHSTSTATSTSGGGSSGGVRAKSGVELNIKSLLP